MQFKIVVLCTGLFVSGIVHCSDSFIVTTGEHNRTVTLGEYRKKRNGSNGVIKSHDPCKQTLQPEQYCLLCVLERLEKQKESVQAFNKNRQSALSSFEYHRQQRNHKPTVNPNKPIATQTKVDQNSSDAFKGIQLKWHQQCLAMQRSSDQRRVMMNDATFYRNQRNW